MVDSIFSNAEFERSKTHFLDSASELDRQAATIETRLTLEEADNILTVYGLFLEHSELFRSLFLPFAPQSCLPFPKALIAGACRKMARQYHSVERDDLVEMVNTVQFALFTFGCDEDSLEEFLELFSDDDTRKMTADGLKEFQLKRITRGYVVQHKLWTIDSNRLAELLET